MKTVWAVGWDGAFPKVLVRQTRFFNIFQREDGTQYREARTSYTKYFDTKREALEALAQNIGGEIESVRGRILPRLENRLESVQKAIEALDFIKARELGK